MTRCVTRHSLCSRCVVIVCTLRRCRRLSAMTSVRRVHLALSRLPGGVVGARTRSSLPSGAMQRPWLQIYVAHFSTAASSTAIATASTERRIDLTSSGFVTLRNEGLAYVDKTSAIVDVLASAELSCRAFFSRPRRFGKSLTISVMAEMLAAGPLPLGAEQWPGYECVDVEGLFGGLAVHDRVIKKDADACSVMERAHFVVKLPLGDAQTGTKLEQTIIQRLGVIARQAYGRQLQHEVRAAVSPGAALEALIAAVPKKVPIAVLVDEYDQGIISDVSEQRWAAAKEGIAALRSLMMASKAQGLDERIQRFIVTGVARFARTSLFSGANNFKDLSGHPIASRMLGFSEQEIRRVFPSKLEALGRHVAGHVHGATLTAEEARDMAMKQLEFWHNGYCFDGTTCCYNPTPVLTALTEQRVASKAMEGSTAQGWMGVPPAALLANGASKALQSAVQNFDLADLEAQTVNPTALLLQTGLLTLKPLTPPAAAAALPATQPTARSVADGLPAPAAEDDDPVVTLQAPNEYARRALLQLVATATARDLTWLSEEVQRVRKALATRDHTAFGAVLVELLKGIPHSMTSMKGDASPDPPPREAPYHTAAYAFLRGAVPKELSSLRVEEQNQFGDADIVLQLESLGGHPAEWWVVEVGAVTRKADRTTTQLIAQKLRQVELYSAQYASQPGKIAAVVVNRDAKEVVIKWREWDVAGRVWKDLPEQ